MSLYSISFEIKTIPKTLNEALRSHWTVYSRESRKIGDEIFLQLKDNLPPRPLKKVEVYIDRYSSGFLDRDNKFFTSKHVLDNLVKIGVIENDTEENIVELHVGQVKTKRGESRKLHVIVKEVA